MYYPLYVDLTHSEMDKYVDLTIQISRKHAMIEAGVFDKKKDKHYLEMQRAKIVSTAVNKYEKPEDHTQINWQRAGIHTGLL